MCFLYILFSTIMNRILNVIFKDNDDEGDIITMVGTIFSPVSYIVIIIFTLIKLLIVTSNLIVDKCIEAFKEFKENSKK